MRASDAQNLAARLQGLAEPDSVVIAEGTMKRMPKSRHRPGLHRTETPSCSLGGRVAWSSFRSGKGSGYAQIGLGGRLWGLRGFSLEGGNQ